MTDMRENNSRAGATLHLLQGSGVDTWQQCFAACLAGDVIVAMDAAVMALMPGSAAQAVSAHPPVDLWVLQADASARGFADGQQPGVRGLVDDAGLLDFLRRHPRCISWR